MERLSSQSNSRRTSAVHGPLYMTFSPVALSPAYFTSYGSLVFSESLRTLFPIFLIGYYRLSLLLPYFNLLMPCLDTRYCPSVHNPRPSEHQYQSHIIVHPVPSKGTG